MKQILKAVPILLATGWLSTALAGTYTTTFDVTDQTYTLGGGAFVETNTCILTPPLANSSGSVTTPDFDTSTPIEAFTALFKIQLGPGSGNAADGVSFNFGPEIVPGMVSSEEGPGGTALSLCFDTYDNGIANELIPTPSVYIKYRGNIMAYVAYAKADMVTSKPENVSMQIKKNGTVTVSYKGTVIFDNVFIPYWTPSAGLFNFSGRTGGEYEEQDISGLSLTTVLQGATIAPTVTANPQSVVVDERSSTNFSVSADGSAPFEIQWYKNNVAIQDATNATLTLGPIPFTDNNAKIKATVKNATSEVTSTEATITVNRDVTAPTVVKANTDVNGTTVTVVYSEPVTDTALVGTNYKINQGVQVNSVSRLNATTVVLATTTLPQGLSFILTVSGVQDTASSPPNTILPNSQVTFMSYTFQVGSVVHKKFLNMDNNANPQTLFSDPRYPSSADRQDLMTMYEYPAGGAYRDAVADPARNYMDTLEGYFIPATTGEYVFFVDGADNVWLFLSSDSDPANKVMIANFGGWTNPRDWHVVQCGSADGLRSDTYSGSQWPNPPITLTKGQRYYMEAIHGDRSWSGADDFAVTFKLAADADPAGGSAPLLTGSLVGTYLDPTGASVTFNQQPADVTILQGRIATFTAVATGQSAYGTTVNYQWKTAPSGSTTFTNIPGATTASYTTPTMQLADSGRQYQLLASVPGLTESSRTAVLTVIADKVPPVVVGAGALASQTGTTFDVGVTFDEPVDSVSARDINNYKLSAGTITGINFYSGSPGVVLTVSGLTAGNTYTVTVDKVADVFGNVMSSTTKSLTVSPMKWGVVGGDELKLGNAVVAVGPNSFDVYSDGIGEWAAYDEATLVYEQITGDFDKEVRVEYQDASSQWARAGLIVRDVTNFGVDRNGQTTNSLAGRYQKIHVNPVKTAMGTAGNDSWEGNRRLDTGGATDSPGGGGTPAYPNAWCRIKRVGQAFTVYRSNDGINWTSVATTTWGVDDVAKLAMPNTVYVGLDYSPENGNVDAALRGMFVAKYRDYRTHTDIVPPPVMTYQRTPTGLTITFEGTLQSADSLGGTWTDMTGVPSPYAVTVPAGGATKFYRAKK